MLEYVETSAGIRQTATRPNSVRVSNWTFPNNNNVLAAPPREGDPWINMLGWAVPIDDENTLRIGISSYPGGEIGEELVRNGAISVGQARDHAATIFSEHRLPDVGAADRISAQDYAAARGQGVIHDRSKEHLGASDAGVALIRRILFREIDAIRAGQPTKEWKRIETPVHLQTLARRNDAHGPARRRLSCGPIPPRKRSRDRPASPTRYARDDDDRPIDAARLRSRTLQSCGPSTRR